MSKLYKLIVGYSALYLVLAITFCGCSWIASHPQEVKEAEEVAEEVVKEVVEAEIK